MQSLNDKKILELKAQIEHKKAAIQKLNFSPKTNCSIELDGVRYNLHTLNSDKLTWLLIKMNCYQMSIKDLGIKEYEICGYTVQNWMGDINSKLNIIAQKTEEDNLKALEKKLGQLLSEDKKTELELSNIEEMLK
jgi:hypothetical protein